MNGARSLVRSTFKEDLVFRVQSKKLVGHALDSFQRPPLLKRSTRPQLDALHLT
jgi:hypothetical protein